MDNNDNTTTFSIRHIAAETGVNPVTLRAWERRYGLIKPKRTPKGHRLYTEQDLFLVKNILFILSQGYAISKVKELLKNEHIHLLEPDNYQSLIPRFQAIASAMAQFNHIYLETEIKALFTLYSPEQFADDILPRLFAFLEEHHYQISAQAFSQKAFLLDLLQAKLYQYLYQNIHSNDKDSFLLIGYRTAMSQSRILHGLLLANVIKAYEHQVDFISGLSSWEEILELAKEFAHKKIVVFTRSDTFHLRQLIRKFQSHGLRNTVIHCASNPGESFIEWESDYLLPTKFNKVYGALHQQIQDEV